MNDCVGKPFTSQELWRCLLKYLKPVSGGNVIEKTKGKGVQSEADLFADAEFMQSLIKTFLRNNRTRVEEIKGALNSGDIKLAHRLAHSLKGNAGQLGQVNLQKAAAEVENQLKDGKDFVTPKQLSTLEAALNKAVFDLEAQIAPFIEQQAQSPKVELDDEKAKELLDKLENLLKRGNPECQAFVNDLRAIPVSGYLVQYIEDFEFEKALLELGEIREKYFK